MRITNAQASSRQMLVWLALLIFSLFALSGCAPRYVAEGVSAPTGEAIAVDLPAFVIDVDQDGQLSVAGVPLADLGAAVGQDLSTLSLPGPLVEGLQAANIQHLQLVNSANGLSVLANGQEIPAISWASGALDTTADVLSELGVLEPDMAQLLQLAEQANVGATLRLPLAEGATELPLVDAEPSEAVAEAQETQNRFVNSVRNNLPSINFTINYDSNGEASLEGISPALLGLLGVSTDALNQDPAVIQQLKDAGVSTIDLMYWCRRRLRLDQRSGATVHRLE